MAVLFWGVLGEEGVKLRIWRIKVISEVAWVVYPAHDFGSMGKVPGTVVGPALHGVFWPGLDG